MRRKGVKRRRVPESVEDLRDEVHRIVGRSGDEDLSQHADDIDELLAAMPEFSPEWTATPHVVRLALLETGVGIVPFEDVVALPDIKHEYPIVLEMLAHKRAQKGLAPITMPMFLVTDEIEYALRPVEPVDPVAFAAALPAKEISPIARRRRKRLLKVQDMTETRRAVLDRDDWECRKCGAPKDLELYRVDESADVYDCEAYVVLCPACMPAESRTVVHHGHALTADEVHGIRSQIALVFQRGAIERAGFAFGSGYSMLKA